MYGDTSQNDLPMAYNLRHQLLMILSWCFVFNEFIRSALVACKFLTSMNFCGNFWNAFMDFLYYFCPIAFLFICFSKSLLYLFKSVLQISLWKWAS